MRKNLKASLLKLIVKKEKKVQSINCLEIKKILLIRPAKIGDAIVSFPLIRELALNFPNANIDVMAGLNSKDIFESNPYVNKIFLKYKKRDFYKTFMTFVKMRKECYDFVIDTTDLKFWFMIGVSFLKAKYNYSQDSGNNNSIMKSDLNFYTETMPMQKEIHYADRMLKYLEYLKISNFNSEMEFYLEDVFISKAISFKNEIKKDLVAINIDSSSKERSLSNDDIMILVNRFLVLEENDVQFVILSLPSRRSSVDELIKSKYQDENVCLSYPTKNILEAAALVSLCKCIITPDTSYIHIASALNINQIGLYKDDNENIINWGPRNHSSKVIRSKTKSVNSIQDFDIEEIVDAYRSLCN